MCSAVYVRAQEREKTRKRVWCVVKNRESLLPIRNITAEASRFALDALTSDFKRRRGEKSEYRSTLHVSATSNVCERLFSAARLILNHLRCNMDPASCELLLFLNFNRQLWDNPRIFDEFSLICVLLVMMLMQMHNNVNEM